MRIEEEALDQARFADLEQKQKKKPSRSVEQAILSSLVAQTEEAKIGGRQVRDFKKEWKVEEVSESKEF